MLHHVLSLSRLFFIFSYSVSLIVCLFGACISAFCWRLVCRMGDNYVYRPQMSFHAPIAYFSPWALSEPLQI